MNRIMACVYVLVILVVSACTSTNVDVYKQCKEQIDAINKMDLYRSYLVPLDSLGQDVYSETVFPEMYDRCELIADREHRQVSVFATIYFDTTGKVRKTIQWWADGGDLNHVAYYDTQGAIVYAVYARGATDFGRLYSLNSKIYIEHSFSDSWFENRFLSAISMTTEQFAREYRVILQMPEGCKPVTFASPQKGNMAFLCARNVYMTPNGAIVDPKDEHIPQAWLGRMVYADCIADGWCRLKAPTFDTPLGYAPIDSLEFYIE